MCERNRKVELLKEIEAYIYRVAFYLLEDMNPAVEALKQTIEEVAVSDQFFQMEEEKRIHFVRRIAIRKSLSIYADL